jgi:hypothetical protein
MKAEGGGLEGRSRGTGGGTWKEGMGVAYLPRYTNHEPAPASPSFEALGVIFTPTFTNHNPSHPRGSTCIVTHILASHLRAGICWWPR